jgi:phage repressor protein C with HTH and peptisase S24 domain
MLENTAVEKLRERRIGKTVSAHVVDQLHQESPNQMSDVPLTGEYRQPHIGERQGNPARAMLPSMGNTLRALRTARHWTHEQAAERMGISRGHFIKLERGERKLTEHTIALAARAFGVPPAAILDDELTTAPIGFAEAPVVYQSHPEVFGPRDLKVYAAVEGGPGQMVVSTEEIDTVPRPWYLGNVKDGYAVLVVGDSMEPVFEPGDMAVINPRLPYMRGTDVILVADDGDGQFTATLKRLMGWTARDWQLRQFNPRKDFTLSRRDWPKALRVVGKHYGR